MAGRKIMGTMVIIAVDGKITEEPVDVRMVAAAAHAELGDYLEQVPYFSQYMGKACVAFVGEHGKMKGEKYNEVATRMWKLEFPLPYNKDHIVGPMVIVLGDERFMKAL